jgi:hypothetical protein
MQPLSESIKLAIQGWQDAEIDLGLYPPATKEQLHAAMERIGRRASADVEQVYTSTGGFGGTDGHGFTLWPLERILQENAGSDNLRWAFADFNFVAVTRSTRFSHTLIESFRFRLQYENELVSSVWIDDGRDLTFSVASSLAEFFHLYLNDPRQIRL